MDNDLIERIAERDIARIATEEERAVLTSSVAALRIWDHFLVGKLRGVEESLARLKVEMTKDHTAHLDQGPAAKQDWMRKRVLYDERRGKMMRFKNILLKKREYIKQCILARQQEEVRVFTESERRLLRKKEVYGYRAALDHLQYLREQKHLSFEECMRMLTIFLSSHANRWCYKENDTSSLHDLFFEEKDV